MLVVGLAWFYLWRDAASLSHMDMPDMPMSGMPRASGTELFAPTFVMWTVMMVGMMRPSAAPTILLYSTLVRKNGARGTVFGQAAYDSYLKCSAVDLKTATATEVHAELESLLGEFHWYYSTSNTRDSLFHDTRYGLAVPLLVYGIPVLGYAWWRVANQMEVPGLSIVILAGLIGAFTSILRRLQSAQAQPVSLLDDPVAKLAELGLGKLPVYFALVSGAIFPVVLLLIFAAGWVKGDLFPLVYTPSEGAGATSFLDFALKTGPQPGAEFARLLVWSFISGFAERFFPDILDKLVASGGGRECGGHECSRRGWSGNGDRQGARRRPVTRPPYWLVGHPSPRPAQAKQSDVVNQMARMLYDDSAGQESEDIA